MLQMLNAYFVFAIFITLIIKIPWLLPFIFGESFVVKIFFLAGTVKM